MSTREISQRPHGMKLGTVDSKPLERMWVYPGDVYGNVDVRIDVVGRRSAIVLSLSPDAQLELVKGILQNVADVSIHCDEELQGIIAQAVKRSSDDAKAVVDAVRRTI